MKLFSYYKIYICVCYIQYEVWRFENICQFMIVDINFYNGIFIMTKNIWISEIILIDINNNYILTIFN